MVTSNEAEQTLKTIRGLMERATIYRAISAPVALLAGLLSLALSAFFYVKSDQIDTSRPFVLAWSVLLLMVLAFNFFLLKKAALRRGDPLFSSGMKLAARGALAPLSVALVLTFGVLQNSAYPLYAATFWIICYALALLGTREFAPVSIIRLGYSFLVFGLACLAFYPFGDDPVKTAALAMGLSFGVLHVIYAAATWPRKSNETQT